MIKKIFKITFCLLLLSNNLIAKNNNFQEGINLFNKEKFQKAKFKFEQVIVLNPKSELSYLYLSKIFKKLEKKILEEQNLNSVILLIQKMKKQFLI